MTFHCFSTSCLCRFVRKIQSAIKCIKFEDICVSFIRWCWSTISSLHQNLSYLLGPNLSSIYHYLFYVSGLIFQITQCTQTFPTAPIASGSSIMRARDSVPSGFPLLSMEVYFISILISTFSWYLTTISES